MILYGRPYTGPDYEGDLIVPPRKPLTRRQREALADLDRLGKLWPLTHNRWDLYTPSEHGRGYSRRTLDALVDAGLARFVHVPGVVPYYERRTS